MGIYMYKKCVGIFYKYMIDNGVSKGTKFFTSQIWIIYYLYSIGLVYTFK